MVTNSFKNSPLIADLIKAAILIAGSEAKLGRATGYSQNAIWAAKRAGRVTAEMAAAIDTATNGAISKERLRPDLFGQAVSSRNTKASEMEARL